MWVRIEDTFYDHPKIIAAGNAAVGLHVRGLSYACHHMTDGKIPRRFVQGCLKTAERLVLFGLWARDGEDYIIHDYLKYNLSAKDVQARREGDRIRKESYRNPDGFHNPVQTDSDRRLDIDKTKTRLEKTRPAILDAPITPEQAAENRKRFSGMVAEVSERAKVP